MQGAYFTNVSVDSQGTPNARYGTTMLHYKLKKKDIQYKLTVCRPDCVLRIRQSIKASDTLGRPDLKKKKMSSLVDIIIGEPNYTVFFSLAWPQFWR